MRVKVVGPEMWLFLIVTPHHSWSVLGPERLRSCFVVRFVAAVPPKHGVMTLPVRRRPSALTSVAVANGVPLDADAYVLVNRSTRLVEPSLLFLRQQARPAPSPRSSLTTALWTVSALPSSSSTTASSTPLLKVLCVLPPLELLSIVLGEWLTSKMAVRRCLLPL